MTRATMPKTARPEDAPTTAQLAGQLATLEQRDAALAERAEEVRRALERARDEIAELYAAGQSGAPVLEARNTVRDSVDELDAIASGRERLAEDRARLETEHRAALGREAVAAKDTAVQALDRDLDQMHREFLEWATQKAMPKVLRLRAALTEAQRAVRVAEKVTGQSSPGSNELARILIGYPFLIPFTDALEAYTVGGPDRLAEQQRRAQKEEWSGRAERGETPVATPGAA